jgi:DNA modification methylase
VTSPPYYGLRDYGTALWDGGDAACDHAFAPDAGTTTQRVGRSYQQGHVHRDCRCGARRIDRQLGLELTPDAYLAAMVQVFRELRRVLRDDGTCWVNMGDSYCSTAPGTMGDALHQRGILAGVSDRRAGASRKYRPETPRGLKPKDLLLMPARLALALQADGWWVRSDIIWAKPNPMPESCRDRPTSAHEHVFLLSKAARYFYDTDAVREPLTESTIDRGQYGHSSWATGQFAGSPTDKRYPNGKKIERMADMWNPAGRNLRNVWTIATAPYAEAHFATFPPALAERCIRAGTSERGCCVACGAPWVRTVGDAVPTGGRGAGNGFARPERLSVGGRGDETPWVPKSRDTTGWRASCGCGAETQPATVLDPFAGSGTTLLVADRLQRHAVGIDLSTTYADMARNRVAADCPLFTSWAPADDPEEARMADLFQEMAAD